MYYVYILRCADDYLYIGHTEDLERRIQWHNERYGSAHTVNRRPVRLVYSETFDSREAAARRERQLKGWTRRKKEALIAGDSALLKRL